MIQKPSGGGHQHRRQRRSIPRKERHVFIHRGTPEDHPAPRVRSMMFHQRFGLHTDLRRQFARRRDDQHAPLLSPTFASHGNPPSPFGGGGIGRGIVAAVAEDHLQGGHEEGEGLARTRPRASENVTSGSGSDIRLLLDLREERQAQFVADAAKGGGVEAGECVEAGRGDEGGGAGRRDRRVGRDRFGLGQVRGRRGRAGTASATSATLRHFQQA
mmetsp:Transcript_20689/g.46941  ORF Transcript_20689/g.46941 Transcript_20689/m.46941 type:complete len:215 (-) Transcript_20689:203-847(-)